VVESSCTIESVQRMKSFPSSRCFHRSDWQYVGETEVVSGGTVLKFTRAVLIDFSFEVPSKLKLEFRVGGSSGRSGRVCSHIRCSKIRS